LSRIRTLSLIVALAAFTTSGGAVVPVAAASDVHCGDVITRDTTLDSDLVCSGNGLVIEGDGHTLDLAGHIIEGSGVGAGVSTGHSDTVVTDGRIEGFSIGVTVAGLPGDEEEGPPTGDVLNDLVVARNVRGISLELTVGTSIVRNVVRENVGEGIVESEGAGTQVEHNVISDNGGSFLGAGVRLEYSSGDVVERNTIARNTAEGITLGTSSGEIVRRNVIVDNASRLGAAGGVFLFDEANGNLIERNTISRNLAGIVLAAETAGNTITRNVVTDNTTDGVSARSSQGTTIDRNRVEKNGGNGISLEVASCGNQVFDNHARANGADGIRVASGDLCGGNHAAILGGNHADWNGDLGIEVLSGDVIDAGNNHARHNGDPAQCVGVRCR
jgi:parallel beta-helix repeat protein